MSRLVSASFFTALALASATASAALTAPSWRPASLADASATLTTYQQWDRFDDNDLTQVGIQDNAPDIANLNPLAPSTLTTDGSGGEFLTGGGNIYSFSGTPTLNFTIPAFGAAAPAGSTQFVVQVRTLGSELVLSNTDLAAPEYDFSRLLLNGIAINTLAGFSYTEAERSAAGAGGGQVDHVFIFSAAGSLSAYAFTLGTRESSTSIDILSIDTAAGIVVPEPAGLAFAPLAAVALLTRRTRR